MKTSLKVLLLLAAVLLSPSLIHAQSKRGPSTAEEREMAIKAARLLETDPLNKDAKKTREWFLRWLIEVPDISVEVCTDYLGPVVGSKKDYAPDIFIQMTFSSAAFIIEHPDQVKDRIAINQAGLEGALKAYEAIQKAKPKVRFEYLDDLLAKREKGELKAYVQNLALTKCQSKK